MVILIKLSGNSFTSTDVRGIRSNRHLVISAPICIVKSAPSQIGTCHGQFGTSAKYNFVIIKYLYIKKKKKSWIY